MDLPWLSPALDRLGLRLIEPQRSVLLPEGGIRADIEYRWSWRFPEVRAALYDREGRRAEERTFLQHTGEVLRIYAIPPGPGLWELRVEIESRPSVFALVARMYVSSASGMDVSFGTDGHREVRRDRDGTITGIRYEDDQGGWVDPGKIETILLTVFGETLSDAHWAF